MHTLQATYIPMTTPSVYADPYFIAFSIVSTVIAGVAFWAATRKFNSRETLFVTIPMAVGIAVIGSVGTYCIVQSSNPIYQTATQKIIHNIETKYDIVSVTVDVTDAPGNFIVDSKTGNYLSNAWVTRTVNETVSSEIYSVVVDAKTGEPTLKLENSAASVTDPKTFLR